MTGKPLLLPLLLLAAAGCDAAPAALATLDAEDARRIAAEIDAAGSGLVDTQVGPAAQMAPAPGGAPAAASGSASAAFSGARDCPAGGRVSVAGTIVHSWDTDARTRVAETAATKTHAACALQGRGGRTLTLDAAPGLALTARRAFRNGAPDGVQTTGAKGAVAYATSDGRSGTCAVDLVSAWDPAARTHRVQGTVCGIAVDVTRTRTG